MNKISFSQLITALLLSSAFMLMCLSAPVGIEYMSGTAISFAIQAVLCIPIILLYKKGFSLSAYCNEKHYVIPCLFALYFMLRGGVSFILVWNGGKQLSLPFSEPLITAILIGIVCLYTASLGICAFARASSIVFGILTLTIAVLLIGAWQRIDTMELAETAENTIAGSTLRNLSLADTLPALFVLLNFTDGKKLIRLLCFCQLDFSCGRSYFFYALLYSALCCRPLPIHFSSHSCFSAIQQPESGRTLSDFICASVHIENNSFNSSLSTSAWYDFPKAQIQKYYITACYDRCGGGFQCNKLHRKHFLHNNYTGLFICDTSYFLHNT